MKKIIFDFKSERQLQKVVDILGDDWLNLLDNQGSPSERQEFENVAMYKNVNDDFAIATDYTTGGGGLFWSGGFDSTDEYYGFEIITASQFLEDEGE